MKVLIIAPSPPEYLGGLSHFTKYLSQYLGDNNIQVDFLCSTLTKEGTLYENYAKNVRIIKKKCYLFADNENTLKMKNPVFNVLTYLLKYGKNYDLIHVHSYIYFSTMQTFFYKFLIGRKIPLILHLHGIMEGHETQTTNLLEKILFVFKRYFFDLIIGKLMFKLSEAIISVNKNDLLISNKVFRVNFSKKHKTYYIPNAIDPKKFIRLENIKREYIGYIQRLSSYSGIDIFLKLVEEYNKIDDKQKFLILGKGPFLSEVKKAMKKYPITYYEEIPHEKMIDIYNSLLIFMVMTRSEGLSTTILEAFSCEVPVIASNVGGNPELVKNGVTGYLADVGDYVQAVKNIQIIKNNNEYKKLGKNARELVLKHYSWIQTVKKIIIIYKKIIKNKKK